MGFLGVRIDEELEEAIKKTGRPASSIARDALRQYLELDRPPISPEHEFMIKEIERLLDEKLIVISSPSHDVKHHTIASTPKPSHKPKAREKPAEDQRLQKALKIILSFFDEGIEPLVAEVAEEAGMSPGGLGMILGRAGIKTQVTARKDRRGRLYLFEMRSRIEKLLEG